MIKMKLSPQATDIYDAYEQVELPNDEEWEEYDNVTPVDELISEDPAEVNRHILTSSYGQGALGFKEAQKPYCGGHDGDDILFEVEYQIKSGKKLKGITKSIAGASGGNLNPAHTALVIDCAGLYSSGAADASFVEGDEMFNSLLEHVVAPPILRLHWTDMGVPPVQYAFWGELLELLPEGVTKVCCHGGHGRTGTALAALYLVATPTATADDAIELVRTDHCSRAIETAGQEEYLRKLAQERDALSA
jgi:hypothetical protein